MEISHDPDPAGHRIYLLTLWQEAAEAPWRAALRPAGCQERIGFADLEALALFLLRLDDNQNRPQVAAE
jgi:hypothetical protein